MQERDVEVSMSINHDTQNLWDGNLSSDLRLNLNRCFGKHDDVGLVRDLKVSVTPDPTQH